MSNLNLFEPAVEETKFHQNFRNILKNYPQEDRDVINDWAKGFVDRDGKFIVEFQTTFNSAFWELYLFAALKELELKVDFQYSAPDFVITNFWNKMCIEATTAHNAKGKVAEWEVPLHKMKPDVGAMLHEATLRLANALTSKYEKYVTSYRYLPQVSKKPFVVAIAPFEQPGFYFQNDQAMRRVVYGYDGPVLFTKEDGSSEVTGHKMMRAIEKNKKVEVPLGFFREAKMNEISAVIFSNTATVGKVRALSKDPNPYVMFETLRFDSTSLTRPLHTRLPRGKYHETVLDGLIVFHNPCANFPISLDVFARQGVAQYVWPSGEKVPRVYAFHGSLIQRTVITMMPKPEE